MISPDVLAACSVEEKDESKNPKKRYIMFLLDEWAEKIDKPLGRKMQPDEAKNFICTLLAKLATGEWSLNMHPK